MKIQILERIAVFFCLTVCSHSVLAKEDKKHAKLAVTSNLIEKGHVNLTLELRPISDMLLTLDAPWKLKIKKDKQLGLNEVSFKKDELFAKLCSTKSDTELSCSLVSKSSPTNKKGDLLIEFTTFVCTKDKTRCYREVHKVEHEWSAAPQRL